MSAAFIRGGAYMCIFAQMVPLAADDILREIKAWFSAYL